MVLTASAVGTRPRVTAIHPPPSSEYGRLDGPDALSGENDRVLREAATAADIDWHDAVVLDVACGRRQYAVEHLWSVAGLRVGADVDRDAVAANSQVSGVCADMYALPFADDSFDVAVSLDTIEHAERPGDFLEQVGRVLRPGGAMVVITPNLLGYQAMIGKLIGNVGAELVWRVLIGKSLPYDLYYRANTLRAIRRKASRAGLSLEQVVYLPFVPHFFYSRPLLRAIALRYNAIAHRLGARWLFTNMLLRLRKTGA